MQDFELWVVDFPVFFGLGWLAARVDMREVLGNKAAMPASYFYRPAKPWWMTETDRAAAALGRGGAPPAARRRAASGLARLYRKRGEHDRHPPADRLLQDHADDLTPPQRDAARFELAQNLRAGLVDRAEEILVKLGQGRAGARGAQMPAGNLPARAQLAARHRTGARAESEDFAFSTSWRNTTASWRKAR